MEGETLSGDTPENGLKIKRKLTSTKKCFCFKDDPSSKRKKRGVYDAYIKYSHLLHSNVNKTENNVQFNVNTPKLIKPCCVKLSPLDHKIYASVTKNSSKILHQNEDLTNDKQNDYRFRKGTTGVQKRMKRKSSTHDLIKTLKPCSVILDKLNLSSLTNFPVLLCSTGLVELKPCSVKLNRINTEEAKISRLDVMENKKPCIVKHKEIPIVVLDDSNDASAELVTSSNSLGLTFKEEEQSSQSGCEEIYQNKMFTSNILHKHENVNIKDGPQNSFEIFSLNSNGGIKTQVCDPSELNSLKNGEFSVTTKKIESSDFDNEKYLECDSTGTYMKKGLEITLSRFSPLCDLYSEKPLRSLKPFEILKDGAVLIGNGLKCNEPSSLKLVVKSYSKSNKDNVVQCQKQISEKNMHHCFHCSKGLPSLKSLYYHLCREKQKRGYPCKFCEKNFDLYRALKKHKKCHALRNSLSCSDTMKSRHHDKRIGKANNVELKKKVDVTVSNTQSASISGRVDNNIEKGLAGKENNSFSKSKPKKLKTKIFLRSISDATTSSGCYSSDSNYLHYIWNSDDSEAD